MQDSVNSKRTDQMDEREKNRKMGEAIRESEVVTTYRLHSPRLTLEAAPQRGSATSSYVRIPCTVFDRFSKSNAKTHYSIGGIASGQFFCMNAYTVVYPIDFVTAQIPRYPNAA